jgi:hypothetical protein
MRRWLEAEGTLALPIAMSVFKFEDALVDETKDTLLAEAGKSIAFAVRIEFSMSEIYWDLWIITMTYSYYLYSHAGLNLR